MPTYELSGLVRLIPRYAEARRTAQLEAARTGQAVCIYRRLWQGRERELKLTVFPDGRTVRPEALHRVPQGFGL